MEPGADVKSGQFERAETATIGIPTYNRAASLKRTLASALAQDYIPLEIVVVDNCSTDQTEEMCQEFERSDNRVRYVRQTSNLGAVHNFRTALSEASGEFFMWLADDDAISPNYVSTCVGLLRARGHALVGGRDVWQSNGQLVESARLSLASPDAESRVLQYLRLVNMNSIYYGVARTQDWRDQISSGGGLGGDWLMVLGNAIVGTIEVSDDAQLVRGETTSTNIRGIARGLGLGWFERQLPYAALIRNVMRYLLFSSTPRKVWSRRARLVVSFRAGLILLKRFGLVEGLGAPLLPAIERRIPSWSVSPMLSTYGLLLRIENWVRRMLG